MFWKIIIDKLFGINISKYDEYETDCNSGDSIRSIAKSWQNEMVQQALYVKNANPLLSTVPLLRGLSPKHETKEEVLQRTIKTWPAEDKYYSKHVTKTRNARSIRSHEVKDDNKNKGMRKKTSQSTNVELKTIDTACDACFLEKEQDEIKAYKKNVQVLQVKCNGHIEEVERLKRENNSLRIELENVYKNCPWKASFYCPDRCDHNLAPKPFEVALEDHCPGPVKNIDSEMIITMKKCKHEVRKTFYSFISFYCWTKSLYSIGLVTTIHLIYLILYMREICERYFIKHRLIRRRRYSGSNDKNAAIITLIN